MPLQKLVVTLCHQYVCPAASLSLHGHHIPFFELTKQKYCYETNQITTGRNDDGLRVRTRNVDL